MIYFSSDHHFDHANIIKYCNRPFSSLREMNETMVRKWNEVITDEDEIYYLGDFSMSFRAAEYYTPQLRGKKYLIPGNHDACHPVHKKSYKMYWKYDKLGWEVLIPKVDFVIPDLIPYPGWLLCHFPYKNADYEDERYRELRPDPQNRVLLHGHVHEKWKVKGKAINVGVDQWDFYPVCINELLNLAGTKDSILK